jgi:dTDP-4-amino-4,6-dideoxygalactose transaminase
MEIINVTNPFLPPREEYDKLLDEIWQRNWLTNNGPFVKKLEEELKQYLRVKELLFLSNGTVAIQIAIKALEIKRQIITTPFSYVATTSSIVWEGCEPVFVDIDSTTFNIDPNKIEDAITPQTEAILATHCFGNACDIEAIQSIASKYSLKVIYDAAHCFGTLYKGKSIFCYGDISTTSFHATKLFHTVEGGAVFSENQEIIKRIQFMRNFGHNGPEKFDGVGINGKNSEFHAAMGICNLKHVADILERRRLQSLYYHELLNGCDAQLIRVQEKCAFNHAYYPVVFRSEEVALRVKLKLETDHIFPRRYFYPSLSHLNYVNSFVTPISDDVSSRILCLPIYYALKKADQDRIVQIIKTAIK